MMTVAEAMEHLAERFLVRWAARTPVAWPNDTAFEAPADGAWVRYSVQFGASDAATFREEEHSGIVYLQIFTPAGTGDRDAREYAERAAAIFRRYEQDGLRFGVPSMRYIGQDAQWLQYNVTAPFVFQTAY
jgi:hypothetical protein